MPSSTRIHSSIHSSIHLWIEGREPKTARKEGRRAKVPTKRGHIHLSCHRLLFSLSYLPFFPHSLFNLTFPPKPALFLYSVPVIGLLLLIPLSVSRPPRTALPCVQLPLLQWIQTPRPLESEHCCWPRRRCAYPLDFLIDCLIDYGMRGSVFILNRFAFCCCDARCWVLLCGLSLCCFGVFLVSSV